MKIVFALHHHQPIGNFDEVIDEACDRAYMPILGVLAKFPNLRVNVHYSGALLEWAFEHRPDVIEALQAAKSNLEWMGGGFYEPILAAIPENDRIDQLRRMQDYLAEHFDAHPRGAWIAERVWAPSLAGTLHRAGFDYTVIDDSAFATTDLDPSQLSGPYAVDASGRTIAVFPISEMLRHSIPDQSVDDIMASLRLIHAETPDRVVVFGDDAERFGVWGTSATRFDTDGWLTSFFEAVTSAAWIEVTTFEAITDSAETLRHVSLPPATYREMQGWAGGYFSNFADRYPTVGLLNHKMTRLSRQLRRSGSGARTGLLRSQCNCAWWHGSFGGVYLPHLRAAVHESMIDARVAHDGDQHRGRGWHELDILDWDSDWAEEIHVELPDQSWVLDPGDGGSMHYYDDKPGRWAVSDVMTRIPESYHPEGETYDPFPHRWLADRLLGSDVSPADIAQAGNEAPPTTYHSTAASGGRGSAVVVLENSDGTVTKTISATDRRLDVQYVLANSAPGRFGPRLPVSVWEGAAEIRVDGGDWAPLNDVQAFFGHRFRFRHVGRELELVISSPVPSELYANPIRTLSQNENGTLEVIFQGIELWPHFNTSGTGTYELTIEIGAAA